MMYVKECSTFETTLVSSGKGKEVDGMDTEFLLQYFNSVEYYFQMLLKFTIPV